MLNRLRYLILTIFFFAACLPTFATHNRAGEITYKWIGVNLSDYKYEITITTYTKTSSFQADRPSLDSVYFGDSSTPVQFFRDSKTDLPDDISINVYKQVHTYLGPGNYLIHFTDPNRNEGVVNIPNSVLVPFYIESLLVINPFLGPNSSPVLTYPPIDRGCVGQIFIHNPNAFDPDGDSLAYQLTICNEGPNQQISGYIFPAASHSFSINAYTGDLVWDSPLARGEYNVAFNIFQYKRGALVGFVRRDMQIIIGTCTNQPPVIAALNDTCVLAGSTLNVVVTATDPDGNNVTLSASGGPFLVTDTPTFTPLQINNDTVSSRFTWIPGCDKVRSQNYYVQFKAKDNTGNDTTSLVDLRGLFIRVIGPGPSANNAAANGGSIDVHWTPPFCTNIIRYKIYRRNGPYNGTIFCPCDNGAPAYTGYALLDTVPATDTTYNDSNNGSGLVIGIDYCYLITAVYPDGSESCASPQACAVLKKDSPVITNADVVTTDATNGTIYVAWSAPNELDTILYPSPYEYRIYHAPASTPANFSQIGSFTNLNDTIFNDTGINTQSEQWLYKIELYYTNAGVLTLKGTTATASSVFLSIGPTDNKLNLSWTASVPWTNYSYDIFKFNTTTSIYDSLTTVTSTTFTDSNLVNGQNYCYYIRSTGTYSFPGIIDPIFNRSQRVCATPFDNVPPCAPLLSVLSDCTDNLNQLTWNNPNNTCADDVLYYYIFYAPTETSGYELIDSTTSATDTMYIHGNLTSISGCYKVVAVDSVGNQTVNPIAVCVDSCHQYVLPSVFTPDGDGENDLFHPCDSTTSTELQAKNCPPYKNVKSVDIKIYNRWGNLEYETTNRDVNWDGKNKDSKKDCPDGVYYYTCKVFFFRISGESVLELHGTVQLLRK